MYKVETYKGEKEVEKGINKLAESGWKIQDTEMIQENKKPRGCSGCLFGGLSTVGAKNQYRVTFNRNNDEQIPEVKHNVAPIIEEQKAEDKTHVIPKTNKGVQPGITDTGKVVIVVAAVLFLLLLFCCLCGALTDLDRTTDSILANKTSGISSIDEAYIKLHCENIDEIVMSGVRLDAGQRNEICSEGLLVGLDPGKNEFQIVGLSDVNGKVIKKEISVDITYEVSEEEFDEDIETIIPSIKPTITPTPVTTLTPVPTAPPVLLLNAADFKKKSIDEIKSKYGEPDWIFYMDAPVYTNFGYEKEAFDFQSNFLSTNKLVDTGTVFFKNLSCSYDNFTLETVQEAVAQVGLEEMIEKDWDHKTTSIRDRYELRDIDGWDVVAANCSDENELYVIFFAEGWDDF